MMSSTLDALRRLIGEPATSPQQVGVYRLTLLEGPPEDYEAAVDLLASGGRRRPNPWLAKRHQGEGVERGKVTLEGRRCCALLAEEVTGMLPRLRPPTEHRCPSCGSRYRLDVVLGGVRG
jgi:hypothetical protein